MQHVAHSADERKLSAPVSESSTKFDPFAAQRTIFEMDLSPSEKLVALAIVQHMGKDGVCWPSLTRLAKMTGFGESTVLRAVKALHSGKDALFERVRRAKPPSSTSGPEPQSNLYRWKGTPITEVRTPMVEGGTSTVEVGGTSMVGVGTPTVTVKQLREQTSSLNNQKNKPKGGEGSPTLASIWQNVEKVHAKLRLEVHDVATSPERVPPLQRDDLAAFFLHAATRARGEWPGHEAETHDAAEWVDYLIRRHLELWFEREGKGGYLDRMAHPLPALAADVASVHADWREEWRARLAQAQEAEEGPLAAAAE